MRADSRTVTGSSPLTRGKPAPRRRRQAWRRLIPAHAGKTLLNRVPLNALSAHPRSRGENQGRRWRRRVVVGSSPLTRGKLDMCKEGTRVGRLIPAHAGKTHQPEVRPWGTTAHPRSRGENWATNRMRPSTVGSSPLTRGKQRESALHPLIGRLIPAHAGKTRSVWVVMMVGPAHPRSRGENSYADKTDVTGSGSSPLTRGKPTRPESIRPDTRLIPAHAGKTGVW